MNQILMNLRLSLKILIAPLVVLIFLLCSGVVSYFSLTSQKAAIVDLFGTRFKSLETSARLIKDTTSVHANLYKVISWATANYEAARIDRLGKEQLATLDAAVATVGRKAADPSLTAEEKKEYQALATTVTEYRKDAFEAIDLASSDVNYATTFMEKAEEKFQHLYRQLNALLERESKQGQITYDSALRNFGAALSATILVLLIAIVVSILLSLLISRMITRPIQSTMAVVQKIAEGNLTQEIALSSRDEIGLLAQSVDTMRQKMGEAVGGSVETSQVLSEAASEQAASIEETSSSLEEMASMTKSNAANTLKANELMAGAKQTIEKTHASMSQLTGSMKEIAAASEETQKIVKTIDEIAFQTNLLALNAAVEAARAGEAGAGFAVVADEVRNLALRAAEAAKNTSNLMTDIVGKIRSGEKLVETTNQDFSHMQASSSKVVELMGEIAAASQEQSQGIEQINTAILEMNRVTQQNAASAEELASIMSTFVTHGPQGEGSPRAGTRKPLPRG